jgi:uncharacterized protein YycO
MARAAQFLRRMSIRWLALFAILLGGCSHSLVVHRSTNPTIDEAYTQLWLSEIESQAQDGDIILRRGYAVLSDLIVWVTPGDELTHAAIYSAKTHTVIEAVKPRVHEQSLEDYVRGAHRVVIVRPAGMSARQRAQAVERARSAIGTGFDYEGFLGFDDPDRFYCSELVVWAIQAEERGLHVDQLVIPGQLAQYGRTVFDSGERGDRAPHARVASR